MSRKKKNKKTQQERRAQEKARRAKSAASHEERPAVPEKPEQLEGRPEPAPKPAKPERRARPRSYSAPAPAPVLNNKYKSLDFADSQDAGDGYTGYDVRFPTRMCLQALFDAIRKERRDEHGVVYIRIDPDEAGASDCQLSYDYAGGLFTRRENLSKNKKAPLLADLLDAHVCKIRACGSHNEMNYFVGIVTNTNACADQYDPSEIDIDT